jgi:hypothetical protein
MTNPKRESFLSIAIAKSRTGSELSTSSEETNIFHKTKDSQRLEAEHLGWKEIHGFRGNKNWNSPFRLNNESTKSPAVYIAKHSKTLDYEDE